MILSAASAEPLTPATAPASSFAVCLDHVRGPFAFQVVGAAYGIDGMTFALGGTSFDYAKEVPIWSKFEVETRLLGYDKKWVRGRVHLSKCIGTRRTRSDGERSHCS